VLIRDCIEPFGQVEVAQISLFRRFHYKTVCLFTRYSCCL